MSEFQSDYWEQEPTKEELAHNQRISQKIDARFKDMKKLQPVDPESGEKGIFVRFEGTYPYVKPVYRTASGKEFFVAQDYTGKEGSNE